MISFTWLEARLLLVQRHSEEMRTVAHGVTDRKPPRHGQSRRNHQ
jgi:hypothetical protein